MAGVPDPADTAEQSNAVKDLLMLNCQIKIYQ